MGLGVSQGALVEAQTARGRLRGYVGAVHVCDSLYGASFQAKGAPDEVKLPKALGTMKLWEGLPPFLKAQLTA